MTDDVQLDDVLGLAENIFEELQQTINALKESNALIKLQQAEIAKLQAEANGRLLADVFKTASKRKRGRPKTLKITEKNFEKFEDRLLQKKAEWGLKTDTAVIRRILENREHNGPKYKFKKENEDCIKSFQRLISKYRNKRKLLKEIQK